MALRQARHVLGDRVPQWVREAAGVATAIAVSVAVVAAVAASARSELLFRDGDSLVTTLVVRSLAAGQPQDWALSTVLFLPETAVVALLTVFGLGIAGTLALAGVVNLVALYAALRVAAGAVARSSAPIAGALLGFTAFALLAATGSSPSRDSLELASLLTTTTYYSATVVAVVLVVGLARRALDRLPARSGGSSRGDPRPEPAPPAPRTSEQFHSEGSSRGDPRPEPAAPAPRTAAMPWGLLVVIGGVAAASVLTNPLFAAWATVPLGLVLACVWVAARSRVALWLIGALVAGSGLGFVGRMPLDALLGTTGLIANTGAGYADPARWAESLGYYGGLIGERWSMPWGAASVVLVVVLWGWCIAATVLLARRGDVGAAVVAACGWVMPLLVVVGAVALGTHAARYLQPVAFGPVLGLVVLPGMLSRAAAKRDTAVPIGAVLVTGASVVLLAVAGAVGIPRISAAASAPDADLDCVVSWVEDSGRTGGGQFWTMRLPKAHLDDPRALVQVDHRLRGYAWLVNRDDFAVGELSFLVTDAQSPEFDLPGTASMTDAETTACGRYTIHDFGEAALALGPQRS